TTKSQGTDIDTTWGTILTSTTDGVSFAKGLTALVSGTYTTVSKNDSSWGILSDQVTTGASYQKGQSALIASTYTTKSPSSGGPWP
ncbi:MAG: hypothetical protein ABIM40_17235, partial [Pseudomonadota bacterium]